jgi:hypothetical protein
MPQNFARNSRNGRIGGFPKLSTEQRWEIVQMAKRAAKPSDLDEIARVYSVHRRTIRGSGDG